MRFYWILVLSLGMGLGPGCGRKEGDAAGPLRPMERVARVHFVGTAHIDSDTNFAGLRDVWQLPQTRALVEQTLQKLARAPYDAFRPRLGGNTNDFAALLRPLLDDLLREEFSLEVRRVSNAIPELSLAVHLNADRAAVWKANLATTLQSWTHLPTEEIQVGGFSGWELKKHLPPNLIRVVRAGDWLVVGVGQDDLPLTADVARRVRSEKRPVPPADGYWLSAEVDWPRLAPWVRLPANIELPTTTFKSIGRGGTIRTEALLTYPAAREWNVAPWQIPTNEIHEPLVAFTAVRGIGPWLGSQPFLQGENPEAIPNQVFCWALGDSPYQVFLAAPMPDATNLVLGLGSRLAAACNPKLKELDLGSVEVHTNDARAGLVGLPWVTPSLQVVSEPSGPFLLGGLYANTPPSPPPAELISQIERTNLLYYDWEITAQRLPLGRNLSQFLQFLFHRHQLDHNSAAAQWLSFIAPRTGNSVTEIVRTAPNQLTLIRNSRVGLTSVELAALANWLEATNFPWGLQLAPPANSAPNGAQPGLPSP